MNPFVGMWKIISEVCFYLHLYCAALNIESLMKRLEIHFPLHVSFDMPSGLKQAQVCDIVYYYSSWLRWWSHVQVQQNFWRPTFKFVLIKLWIDRTFYFCDFLTPMHPGAYCHREYMMAWIFLCNWTCMHWFVNFSVWIISEYNHLSSLHL